MRRREFITLLGGAAATWPVVARAQRRDRLWRIGYIEGGSASTRALLMSAFQQKLKELGYAEGQYEIVAKYADGNPAQIQELADDLIRTRPDAILAVAPQPAFAVARASSAIPIVFVGVGDPVATGLVASLARPGANVTGLSMMAVELTGKRIELFKEAIPGPAKFNIIVDPGSPVSILELNEAKATAAGLGITVRVIEVRSRDDLAVAFATLSQGSVDVVFVLSSPMVFPNRQLIADHALKQRLPSVCAIREYAQVGCMMSYGPNYLEHFRRAAEMIDRILKGAKPSDIPVEQPRNYELIVNLKTAKAIGVSMPEAFLLRADEVIE